jgi:hypothetical protein
MRNYKRIYKQKVRDMERRVRDGALDDAKIMNIPLRNYLSIKQEVDQRQEHGLKVDKESVRKMKLEKQYVLEHYKKIKSDKQYLKEVIEAAERAGLKDVAAFLKTGRV